MKVGRSEEVGKVVLKGERREGRKEVKTKTLKPIVKSYPCVRSSLVINL